ncbi:MAG: glycosyltransferase [Bacteroidales bacterium]|nr:glycosyltransferase [Bacteroidales bacterium]
MAVILHIVESFAGGVLSFLADLTRYQVAGNEVHILYGLRAHTPTSLTEIFDSRVNLTKAEHFNGAVKTLLNPLAYREVRRRAEEIKPDIVHLHSSAAGFVGRMALPSIGFKMFYTPHGYSFLKQDSPRLLRKCFRATERILAEKAVTVACGKGEYEESVKLGGKPECVCNGINPESLDGFAGERTGSDNFTICTCGRIMCQKNPPLFNELARMMPDCRFVWIGDGEMRDVLDASNVEITGWKERNESLEILSGSDVFVMTSLWEGFPIALLEAMYLSKPCVVSNVIGNRDIVEDGKCGYICNSADEFTARLEELRQNCGLRREMGINSRNVIASEYTFDKVADRYEKIYFDNN